MYVSVLLQTNGSRAIQYFRLILRLACSCSADGKILADAANSGPVTFPRIVQGATRTCALLRMRFVLPISLRVITKSRSESSPNHTGVATAAPFFRKVVSEIYFWSRIAEGTWPGIIYRFIERLFLNFPRMPPPTTFYLRLSRVVRLQAEPIDPTLSSVLKALHAQMDARALTASQKKARGAIRPTRSSTLATGLL
jgi:hypothetical protein